MDSILASLANSLEAKAIFAMAALAVVDFATGSLRAISNGTFTLDAFATWVRTSLIHVVIVALVIVVGVGLGPITIGEVDLNVLTITGMLAAASFAATAVKSILDNVNPKVADVVPPDAT